MATTTPQPLSKLNIFSGKGVQMRTFHITWLTFFVCFMAWFAIAPFNKIVYEQLGLSKAQQGNILIASVSATIIARLIIGRLVDAFGPRKTYTVLLIICSIPVMLIGLSQNYITLLLMRLAIGVIGASFVLTQYHTSVMFAPQIKGTANAVAGGFGNTGGGAAQILMPLVAAGIVAMGISNQQDSWRYAMVVPGILMLVMAFVYYRYTKDTPAGNFEDVQLATNSKKENTFMLAAKDYRTWILTLAYAACFGVEITVDNVAVKYFQDNFGAALLLAGALASIFGWINIFARAIGGIVSDKVGLRFGFTGKIGLLTILLLLEGTGIMLFAKSGNLTMAIVMMFFFGLCLKMANGATYSMVPFVNPKAVGSVAGIVGAGGNLGAMLIGFLFKALPHADAFFYLGVGVFSIGVVVLAFRLVMKAKLKATDNAVPVLATVK
jgi:NNP family nitrate/nitrite transporter-like MFS transporter